MRAAVMVERFAGKRVDEPSVHSTCDAFSAHSRARIWEAMTLLCSPREGGDPYPPSFRVFVGHHISQRHGGWVAAFALHMHTSANEYADAACGWGRAVPQWGRDRERSRTCTA